MHSSVCPAKLDAQNKLNPLIMATIIGLRNMTDSCVLLFLSLVPL